MNSIQIQVTSNTFEVVTLNLDEAQVTNMYNTQVAALKEIEELKKKVKDAESSYKYEQTHREKSDTELMHANMLMTALGVQEKTQEEEKYYQKQLPVATRIALYIAASK